MEKIAPLPDPIFRGVLIARAPATSRRNGSPSIRRLAVHSFTPATWAASVVARSWVHAHRIESGFPLYGLDLTDDNLAHEAARTQRAISCTKGCYLGQEPIARIDALGHVNRELRILRLNSTSAPEAGAVIRAENGQEIGAITSSVMVPGEDRSVALGYMRSSHAKPETAVIVRTDDREIPATVFWNEQSTPIR